MGEADWFFEIMLRRSLRGIQDFSSPEKSETVQILNFFLVHGRSLQQTYWALRPGETYWTTSFLPSTHHILSFTTGENVLNHIVSPIDTPHITSFCLPAGVNIINRDVPDTDFAGYPAYWSSRIPDIRLITDF